MLTHKVVELKNHSCNIQITGTGRCTCDCWMYDKQIMDDGSTKYVCCYCGKLWDQIPD